MTQPPANPNNTPSGAPDARLAELISALADGQLTGAERAEAEAAVAASPESHRLMNDFQTLSSAIRALPAQAPRTDLAAAVRRRLDAEAPARGGGGSLPIGRSPRGWMWAALAIAAAVALMVTTRDGGQNDVALKAPAEGALADARGPDRPAAAKPDAAFVAVDEPEGTDNALADAIVADEAAPPPAREEAAALAKLDSDAGRASDAPSGAASDAATDRASRAMGRRMEAVQEDSRDRFAASEPADPAGVAVNGVDGRVPDAIAEGLGEGGRAADGAGLDREAPLQSVIAETQNFFANNAAPEPNPALQLFVSVQAKPEALRTGQFVRTLGRNQMEVEPMESLGAIAGSSEANEPADRQRGAGTRPAIGDRALAADVELVLMDAPASQVLACLADLKGDYSNYDSIEVETLPAQQPRSARSPAAQPSVASAGSPSAEYRSLRSPTQSAGQSVGQSVGQSATPSLGAQQGAAKQFRSEDRWYSFNRGSGGPAEADWQYEQAAQQLNRFNNRGVVQQGASQQAREQRFGYAGGELGGGAGGRPAEADADRTLDQRAIVAPRILLARSKEKTPASGVAERVQALFLLRAVDAPPSPAAPAP
ncbi:hypothetical protein Pla175_04680 [Pirellulimonas nuda]|uniref:Anti sigma-E protein RseA N-terminal domain-containing protein n=1 Tax=Pirellulimonas nuda TaxID=2528009 RepID=A0A518D6K3_9BACT|nr:RseA family anti-sigma factor [Pirellulimonas nuda]QDU87113.1 hypothetical protein Pla175_04680 [Pirellulimonas nuda]